MSWKKEQLAAWAERDTKIAAEYALGSTMLAIGLKHGVGKQRVSQILHRLGVPIRKRGRPVKLDF